MQLRLALYGHPLSGVFWERHCQKALFAGGWKLIEGWESTYRHVELGIVLSIYVDDFKMAGRSVNLQKGWETITKAGIRLDPEELGHFLGCSTKLINISEETAAARLEHIQPIIQAQSSYDSYYGEDTPQHAGGKPPADAEAKASAAGNPSRSSLQPDTGSSSEDRERDRRGKGKGTAEGKPPAKACPAQNSNTDSPRHERGGRNLPPL